MMQMQPQSEVSGTTWEALTPTSFQTALYVPSLKIFIAAGSFIRYTKGETALQVGRIIEVVSSIDLIPQPENHPLIHAPLPSNVDNEISEEVAMPVQFAKVNLFKDRLSLRDRDFPADNFSDSEGWQRVVQLDQYEWIPSHMIIGLSFVFMEERIIPQSYEDCRGMSNFFVLKYRLARNGKLSNVSREACPPFPSAIKRFREIWSLCHCELIFNSLRQIRQEMHRILCRGAQSQGDFAAKNAKMQLSSCSWFYITSTMKTQGWFALKQTLLPHNAPIQTKGCYPQQSLQVDESERFFCWQV